MERVFVSYASGDVNVASSIVGELERMSVACWIAPRDIPSGAVYTDALFTALQNCRAVLVICSGRSNSSSHVLRELEIAARFSKRIVPIALDAHEATGGMGYLLAGLQQVQLGQQFGVTALSELVRELATPRYDSGIEQDSTCSGLLDILRASGIASDEARRIVLGLRGAIAECQQQRVGATFALMHVFQKLPSMDAPELEGLLRDRTNAWLDGAYVGVEACPRLLWPRSGDPLDRRDMDVVRRSFHNSRNDYAGGGPHPSESELVVDYCVRPGVRIAGPAHEPGGTVPAWVAVRLGGSD